MIDKKLNKEIFDLINENALQIRNLKPITLYDNIVGTDSSINIPTIYEYEYIDVSYVCNNFCNTRRIYKSNYNHENNLISIYTSNNVFIIYCNNWIFSETSFVRTSGYYLYMISSGVRELNTNSNNIKITKIVGYK